MEEDAKAAKYACKCLNILITAQETDQQPPTSGRDYVPLYVGEDGIEIVHRQLSLRTRSAATPLNTMSEDRYLQYTTVSCLVCDTETYRILSEVTRDSESKEGPILPTDEWVESEVLHSKSGWIEVCVARSGCISGNEVERTRGSPYYSPHFSVVVPGQSATANGANLTKLAIPPDHTFLPRLPTFLLPPPFTPSHPIHLHLARMATRLSDSARNEAEANVAKFAQDQLSQVDALESELKGQLDLLWRNARDSLRRAEHQRDTVSTHSIRRLASPSRSSAISASLPHGAAVVREFRPSTFQVHRSEIRPRTFASSGLSASLATSSFHVPRSLHERSAAQSVEHREQQFNTNAHITSQSPPPYASNPSSLGTTSESPTASDVSLAGARPMSLARNMNAAQDTSVTYRYYVIEEQERARSQAKAKALETALNAQKIEDTIPNNGETTKDDERIPDRPAGGKCQVSVEAAKSEAESQMTPSSQKTPVKKSQRKVTFDVNPDVVTIKREVNAEKDELPESVLEDDMIFDIDGSDGEGPADGERCLESKQSEVTRFISSPNSRNRKDISENQHSRNNSAITGLPRSFVALRPMSLPSPSNVRPPLRTQSGQTLAEPSVSPRRSSQQPAARRSTVRPALDMVGPLQQHELELRKLVAADIPSHRGLWSRNEMLRTFGRNGKSRPQLGTSSPTIEEEEEEKEGATDGGGGMTGNDPIHSYSDSPNWRTYRPVDLSSSLPIAMGPIRDLSSKHKSAAANEAMLAPLEEGEEEDSNEVAPEKVRRQAHAERDRLRAIDPGILDFVTDDDDEHTESGNTESTNCVSSSRGKQYALKIIAARNAIPEEGMWRSLAT